MAGVQNQYAPNAYLRLWSCLAGFARDDLTRCYEEGSVVQGTLMRGTIHAVSAADYHPFVAALRTVRREWALRVHRGSDASRDAVVARVRAAMAGGAVPRDRLRDLIGTVEPAVDATLDTDLELLRVPPSGTWERRRADLYALADASIGHDEIEEQAGMAHLVRRYLGGFGPATVQDIASFIGMKVTPLKAVVAGIELRRFVDDEGGELIDVPDAPLPPEDVEAPVRFLPTWDALLLVHARRKAVLPEPFRPIIFSTKMPPSYPTVLVDGIVAGTWRWEGGEVQLHPLRAWSAAERAAVEDEAHALASFHGE